MRGTAARETSEVIVGVGGGGVSRVFLGQTSPSATGDDTVVVIPRFSTRAPCCVPQTTCLLSPPLSPSG